MIKYKHMESAGQVKGKKIYTLTRSLCYKDAPGKFEEWDEANNLREKWKVPRDLFCRDENDEESENAWA